MRRLAAVLVSVLAGCGFSEDSSSSPARPAAPPAIQVALVEVRTAEVSRRIEVTGLVAAVSQVTLSSKVQGAVQEVRVREGAAVSRDQTLVVLDSRDLQAGLARADAELENARAYLARMERLFAEDSVAKQELENAARAFKVAEAARQAVLAQLSYTVVKAPFDGVITEKYAEAGELAVPGRALLKMEDARRLRLEATIAEGDLKALARGDRIPVVIDALGPDPLVGTVVQILPAGDPSTHTFLVKCDLPRVPGLKSGMFGRLQLDTGSVRTIVVPKTAVIERGELTGVFVAGADGLARLRWVKVGRDLGDRLEILSGLNVGERVLAEGAKGVDGASVR